MVVMGGVTFFSVVLLPWIKNNSLILWKLKTVPLIIYVMKKTLLLLLALVVSATAWAIEQDSDGYYLIGSIDDWKAFAELATTTHDANARMIADIDLGDDQTKVEALKSPYKGTFDGQGFTLTVQYDSTDEMCAPFYVIGGATIRNLHTEGSITSTRYHSAGIVGKVHNGTVNVVERCISSVNISGWSCRSRS